MQINTKYSIGQTISGNPEGFPSMYKSTLTGTIVSLDVEVVVLTDKPVIYTGYTISTGVRIPEHLVLDTIV
jgi:hypothetical protein